MDAATLPLTGVVPCYTLGIALSHHLNDASQSARVVLPWCAVQRPEREPSKRVERLTDLVETTDGRAALGGEVHAIDLAVGAG